MDGDGQAPNLRPTDHVRTGRDADVVVQARAAPVTRPVLDVKPWVFDVDLPSGALAPASVRGGRDGSARGTAPPASCDPVADRGAGGPLTCGDGRRRRDGPKRPVR
jgi:hypothetical protein